MAGSIGEGNWRPLEFALKSPGYLAAVPKASGIKRGLVESVVRSAETNKRHVCGKFEIFKNLRIFPLLDNA